MQTQQFKIIKTNKGIANRYPNYTIEIHKALFNSDYQELLKEIIEHEKNHTEGWSWKDFMLDVKGFKNRYLYWQFLLSNPSSWIQFSPVYRSSWGEWFLDVTLMITYGILFIFIGAAGWIML